MIRTYCDLCGVEISNNRTRLRRRIKKVFPPYRRNINIVCEVKVLLDGICDDGVFCDKCIIEMIKEGEDY